MGVLVYTRDLQAGHHVLQRRLSVGLPAFQSKKDMNPTLLVSWFCTISSLVIILIRLLGRWVRNEKLFSEDKVMFWSIIPLLSRMAFVHVVLIWGTNNTVTTSLTELQIYQREIGSKFVLPARILFATYIWVCKVTVLQFLQKLVASTWHKSYDIAMRLIYGFLAATYVAVVASTLAECHPFKHYWQVIPDPGVSCRAAPVQLITMGVCEIVTDLVLVVYPIPLVLMSGMSVRRKLSLILLFLLSIILAAIAAYRIPLTLERNASQQYRSLLASLEILASTTVANAIVIGSFLRDRGVKKAKFRAKSVDGDVISRVLTATGPQTRSNFITQHHWGSDEDLVRDVGLSLQNDLRFGNVLTDPNLAPRLAPVAETPYHRNRVDENQRGPMIGANWTLDKHVGDDQRRRDSDVSSVSSSSTDIKLRDLRVQMDDPISPGIATGPAKKSFFETGETMNSSYILTHQSVDLSTSKSHAFLSDVGGLLSNHPRRGHAAVAVASQSDQPRTSLHPRDARPMFRTTSPFGRTSSAERHERRTSRKVSKSPPRSIAPDEMDIADAGGLLQ